MPKILVVDDSLIDRRLATGLLRKHLDCEIIEASDGAEALSLLTPPLPDLVLTDLQMPEVDGLELVESVRGLHPIVPVILMTAKGSEDIAAAALKRGAAGYVPKKRLANDLIPAVTRLLVSSTLDKQHSRLMHHLQDTQFLFELHNDLELIGSVVAHVQELLRCLPLGDETERLRVGIALEEALKNALYHGNLEIGAVTRDPEKRQHLAAERLFASPWGSRRIHFSGQISRERALFCIRDDGPGFDPSEFLSAELDADEPECRGVFLMQSIMDSVVYNDAGNEVTLEKHRLQDEPLDDE